MRARAIFVGLALATIAIGLVEHRTSLPMPPAVRDVAGDALWAMMIAWWMGALVPAASLGMRALVAVSICWLTELSQLYQAPWINSLRDTTLGQLVLGSGFDPRDLVAYAAGVGAAVLLERMIRR